MQTYPQIGFHAGPAGNHNGLGDYMRRLDEAQLSFPLISADHYGHLFEATQLPGAHYHHLLYRPTTRGQDDGFDYDTPDYSLDPTDAAERHWDRIWEQLPIEFDRERVWVVVLNEPDHERSDWLGRFGVTVAEIAYVHGARVALFGFSSGEPEPADWRTPGMEALIRLCAERPDQVAIALHEYNWDERDFSQVYPHHVGRFQWLYRAADELGVRRPTVFITEFGWSHHRIPDWSPTVETYLRQCATLYRLYNVNGAMLWYLGGGPEWEDIHNQTQRYIQPLTEWTLRTRLNMPGDWAPNLAYPLDPDYFLPIDPPQPPQARLGDARVPYRRKYYRVSRHATLQQFLDVCRRAFDEQATVGFSNDDAGIGVGLGHKQVIEVGGEYAAAEIASWYKSVYGVDQVTHAPFYGDPPPPPPDPGPDPLPAALLDVAPVNQRNPRWAGATIGQPTGHSKTIGSWGCLLVCYQMWANFRLFNRMDLLEFNAFFAEKGAFDGPNLNNGGLQIAFGSELVDYAGWLPRSSALMVPKIREWLTQGNPVPCRVDFRPATEVEDQHWVLIVGYREDGEWIINDPWTGRRGLLSEVYPISGEDVLEALFYAPVAVSATPPALGIHLSADGFNGPQDLTMLEQLRPDICKVLSSHRPEDLRAAASLAQFHNFGQFWIVRAFLDFGGRLVTPQQFVDWTLPDVLRTVNILRDYGRAPLVELHNEPNLVSEGCGTSWTDGRSFADWLDPVIAAYRGALGRSVPLLFPGLSPGRAFLLRPISHRAFWEGARSAIDECDALALHSYWSPGYPMDSHPDAGFQLVAEAERLFPGMPIYITEASNNSGLVDPLTKATQYAEFWRRLAGSQVRGITYFVLSATNPAWGWDGGSGEVWTPEMAAAVRRMSNATASA